MLCPPQSSHKIKINALMHSKLCSKIAICPGAGAKEFEKLKDCKIDVFITGEMSHHQILEITSNLNHECFVLLFGHCNTERFFLKRFNSILSENINSSAISIEISEMDGSTFAIV